MTTTYSLFSRRGICYFTKVITLVAAAALAGCGGGGGSDAPAPAPSPAPVVQLTLSASQVATNQASTLTWSSTDATSCAASGAWVGTKGLAGSFTVTSATTGTYTYNISCTGTGGTGSASAALVVVPTPAIKIAVSPSQVLMDQPSTLTWSTTNASSCTASGAWAGAQATSGSLMVTKAVAENYTYGISCTGAGGATSASAVLSVVAALSANALAITVDSGPNNASFNMPFVSVTVCRPRTAICQTVDHVQVDTGSYGLRLLASAFNPTTLALPAVTNAAGTPVAECTQFVSGYTWGPVRLADVKLSAEIASSLPIQIIGDTASPYTLPAACSSRSGADLGTKLGANGILGVGMRNEDCAPCSTSTAPGLYYACSTAGCVDTLLPLASQVANPVPKFSVNNNGVVVMLPGAPAGGSNSLSGMLVFGIGTQSNNQLGSAKVYTADIHGNFTTVYKGTTYNNSFIDSGSNGVFFTDSSITQCSPSVADGFYCPPSTLALSAVNTGSNAAVSGPINFTVENIQSLSNARAAANVGGTLSGLSQSFDWGLPFFFGRTVFVVIEGASPTGGTGPYWAY